MQDPLEKAKKPTTIHKQNSSASVSHLVTHHLTAEV